MLQISCEASNCEFDFETWDESNETIEAIEAIEPVTNPRRIFKDSKVYYSHNIHFFNATDIETYDEFECDDDIALPDRNGFDVFEYLCVSSMMTTEPTQLRNIRNEMKKIINNSYYTQRISYIKCS